MFREEGGQKEEGEERRGTRRKKRVCTRDKREREKQTLHKNDYHPFIDLIRIDDLRERIISSIKVEEKSDRWSTSR